MYDQTAAVPDPSPATARSPTVARKRKGFARGIGHGAGRLLRRAAGCAPLDGPPQKLTQSCRILRSRRDAEARRCDFSVPCLAMQIRCSGATPSLLAILQNRRDGALSLCLDRENRQRPAPGSANSLPQGNGRQYGARYRPAMTATSDTLSPLAGEGIGQDAGSIIPSRF